MPRIARIVAVGLPHHVTQRGNYQQNVFLDDSDRKQYLLWMQKYSSQYGLSILTYCLMQNHVHFITIPHQEDSLAKTFNITHMRYSQYFNRKTKTSGHLWQGRFYSCVLDEPHLVLASRYIERNPVRANIVKTPWEWKWSSALAHIKGEGYLFKLSDLFKFLDMSPEAWGKYIDLQEEEKILEKIKKHTLTGRPLGEVKFIEDLENRFKRRLSALPRGRPAKN